MATDQILVEYIAKLDKLEKQVSGLGSMFDKLDSSVKKSQKAVSGFQKQSSQLVGTLKNVGSALGIAFGAQQIINQIKSFIDINKEFEKELSSLQSILGVTREVAAEYGMEARRIGLNSTKSAVEVVQAFKLIGSAQPELLKSREALVGVTEQAIVLAEAAEIDVPTAAMALTGALNQFQIPAEEAERVINALAAGSKFGAAAIPQVSDAIDKFGAVAAANNVTLEQSVGLTETLAERNIQGAEAGTQLRNIILKLSNAGKGFVDGQFDIEAALKQTNEELRGIEDPIKRGRVLTRLFGLESVTAGQVLLDNIGKFKQYTDSVTGTNTAIEQADINTDNLDGALSKLGNTWEEIQLSGGGLNDTLKDVVGTFTSVLRVAAGVSEEQERVELGATALKLTFKAIIAPIVLVIDKFLELIGIEEGVGDFIDRTIDGFLGLDKASKNLGNAINNLQQQQDKLNQAKLNKALNQKQLKLEKKAQEGLAGSAIITGKSLSQLKDELKELTDEFKVSDITDREFLTTQARKIRAKKAEIASIEELLNTKKKENKEDEQDNRERLERLKAEQEAREEFNQSIIDEAERLAVAEENLVQFRLDNMVKQADVENGTFEQRKENLNRRIQDEIRAEQFRTQTIINQNELEGDELTLVKEQLEQKITDIKKKGVEERKQLDEEETQSRIEQAEKATNTLRDISGLFTQFTQVQTNIRLNDLEREKEQELANFEGTEEQKEALEEQFRAKEARIKREQAIKDKAAALFEVDIQGAIAAVKAFNTPVPPNFALLALSLAQTAAQSALILSQPIPQFASGVEGFSGGLAKVHKDELMYLPQGTNVFNRKASSSYSDEINAMNMGNFESLLFDKYIQPALHEQLNSIKKEEKREMMTIYDESMVRAIKKPVNLTDSTIEKLGKQMVNRRRKFRGWA